MPLTVSATGVAQIPPDYAKWIDMTFIYNGIERQVEVIDGFEFNNRKSHAVEVPTRKYPIATFAGESIRVAPKNLQFVNFTYFRKPTVPFYDYCQDSDTLNEIYMPVGSGIYETSTLGWYNLRDSAGLILATNVLDHTMYSHGRGSQTVELEWEPRFHPRIAVMLLAMVGVNIQEAQLTQYAEAKTNA
jgi:hypothetical protein